MSTASPPYPVSTDVLVVGGGLAGLSLALRLAENAQVTLLAKADLPQGSSLYAQGGVAAVLNETDSYENHIQDTLTAGAGLCHGDTVEYVVRHGPAAIRWLIDQGVPFTLETGADGHPHYHLTQEGGHSHRRVVHAADATGRAMETTLEALVRRHPNIHLYEHHIAVDLITRQKLRAADDNRCLGVYALNKITGLVGVFSARVVVLATGGASKVYLYTTNPDTSTGDGIAMAWRAGCRVANMEFMQFHPTCLYHPSAKSFLISEAVRGEGGRLLLPDGTPFMQDHDPRGELAPRDVVARAIDYEMKRHGLDCVYLDISHKPADFITGHFPNIYRRCLEFGFDMTRKPLPVVPAAHYTCGGVVTDLHGQTDLHGLYAIGECAHTGLHGANRLASNSLLECVVFAEAAATDILAHLAAAPPPETVLRAWDESRVSNADELVVVSHNWKELRSFMWDYVGIVRTNKRLERALHRANLLHDEILEYYSNFRINNDLVELRNLALVAELIIRSAQRRKESRGLHYTLDYPQPDETRPPQDTILVPENY
ncbi:MAG: L-aspartate oxidase [Candidatus Muproteobacteria bacterium RBG_19FT_COMBO_61_10]|uniref:L-aspartate oxidase n=1 Tax=Candidatus Muproteobacteria bacterium RBG_19FT_COMBO_61_10 TaxID=1817761 RepID=A0A1F6UMS1_9PROT|nr:MAG: L-aspartate oxidase [Candidatus Muproteobacteria bacterium RBG_19FT_COMBO_61_10]